MRRTGSQSFRRTVPHKVLQLFCCALHQFARYPESASSDRVCLRHGLDSGRRCTLLEGGDLGWVDCEGRVRVGLSGDQRESRERQKRDSIGEHCRGDGLLSMMD